MQSSLLLLHHGEWQSLLTLFYIFGATTWVNKWLPGPVHHGANNFLLINCSGWKNQLPGVRCHDEKQQPGDCSKSAAHVLIIFYRNIFLAPLSSKNNFEGCAALMLLSLIFRFGVYFLDHMIGSIAAPRVLWSYAYSSWSFIWKQALCNSFLMIMLSSAILFWTNIAQIWFWMSAMNVRYEMVIDADAPPTSSEFWFWTS